ALARVDSVGSVTDARGRDARERRCDARERRCPRATLPSVGNVPRSGNARRALDARSDSLDASAHRLQNAIADTQSIFATGDVEMTNTTLGQIELSMTELATVGGGFKLPGWVKTAGEIAAPVLMANPVTMPAGVALANKKALGHGAI